jgi:hypothetical protein
MCVSGYSDNYSALKAVYPDYEPATITKPHGYWKNKENQKEFFDQLATTWNIQTVDDWNKVTHKMVQKAGGSFITTHYNGSLQRGMSI